MKKIIAALDGLKYSSSTREFAMWLAEKSNALLAGIFLEDFTYHGFKLYDMVGSEGVSGEKLRDLMEKDRQAREKAVSGFELACRESDIAFTIHRDRNFATQELIRETIYSDLLVIDARESFTHFEEDVPSEFLRDIFSELQCPVFVVPPKFQEIEKLVLLYDGKPSSVYACKMFSYLLPWLKVLPCEVVSVKDEGESSTLPAERLMKEFIDCHFPKSKMTVLKGDPEVEILTHLQSEPPNTLVVLGAYSRGVVSRWFKTSMADRLISEFKIPLFIAHYK